MLLWEFQIRETDPAEPGIKKEESSVSNLNLMHGRSDFERDVIAAIELCKSLPRAPSGLVANVFTARTLDGKQHVGCNYQRDTVQAGDRIRFDHGTTRKSTDAEVIWVRPEPHSGAASALDG